MRRGETMLIDINKKYMTNAGNEVRIYSVGNGGEYPVHGSVRQGDVWFSSSWTAEGKHVSSGRPTQGWDLVALPVKITGVFWCNMYRRDSGEMANPYPWPTKAKADAMRRPGCLACLPFVVDCYEGTGLFEEKSK